MNYFTANPGSTCANRILTVGQEQYTSFSLQTYAQLLEPLFIQLRQQGLSLWCECTTISRYHRFPAPLSPLRHAFFCEVINGI
jgi:hypothetical protein